MMISDTTRMGNGALSLPPATIQADGTVTLRNIGPATYSLTGSIRAPVGWWLRSAVSGGRDLLDGPVIIRSESLDGVVFTFSDRRNELVGSLEASRHGRIRVLHRRGPGGPVALDIGDPSHEVRPPGKRRNLFAA